MAKNITLTSTQIMAAEQLRLIWNAKKKKLGLTQEKVAQLCQWNTQAAFNAYLQARVPLNTDAILRLSKVLQIHPTEIMPALADILPTNNIEIVTPQEAFSHAEKMIINMLRSITDEQTNIAIKKNLEGIAFQSAEKARVYAELMTAYEEIAFYKVDKERCASELVITNRELDFQNIEKEKRASEILIANQNLIIQNAQKEKLTAELLIANQELAFQNTERGQRAFELETLNFSLIVQYDERQKLSNNLASANELLFYQNVEKEKRADELLIANKELAFQNSEKEKRADELLIANKELAFQNSEKEKRAAELQIANEKITVINKEFITTNEELIFQNVETEKRTEELVISYKEKDFQVLETSRLLTKLVIANQELVFQNAEKEKRAAELVIINSQNEMLIHQVNHLQKIESIGRLTAGVSHDFNNILACMLGFNELNTFISDDIKDETLKSELDNNIKQIANAGQRAVELIQKMMTYSRQDTKKVKTPYARPTPEIINEVLDMLRPALTSLINLEFINNCGVNDGNCNDCSRRNTCDDQIQIDAIDLHQIITNLAMNARDAMKERGGCITISLDKVAEVNTKCVACTKVIEGDFIELGVADNGTGIEPKIIDRMFDPFFTTKPQGQGTGLGLSTLTGLVHSALGHIVVDSNLTKPNQGTMFKLLFPVATPVLASVSIGNHGI